MQLVRVNVRANVEDRDTLALAAFTLAALRFPALTLSDVDPRLLPADKSGGTALYALHCHQDDIAALKRISGDLLDAKPFDVAAARRKALAGAMGELQIDPPPPLTFK